MRLNFRPLSRIKPTSGFTLVELLVGLTLWIIVSISLTHVFQAGLRLWKRSQQKAPLYQEARFVMDQLGRQYRAAIDVPGIAWTDQNQTVTFAFVEENHIEKVTYSLTTENGNSALHQLRQELSPSGFHYVTDTTLATSATQLQWEYAYASPSGKILWQSGWTATPAHRLPCGFRLRLILLNEVSQPEEFTRTFFTPLSRPLPWAS